MIVPVIETARVRLREHRLSDFDAIALHWQSDRTRHSGGPLDRLAAWRAFSTDCAQWQLRGYGMWIIADRNTDAPMGWIGFYEPEHYTETELGWVLLEAYEGQGLAHEGVSAARSFGASSFGIQRPISFIDAENTRSIALAERLGAVREATRDGKRGLTHVYRHPEQVQ